MKGDVSKHSRLESKISDHAPSTGRAPRPDVLSLLVANVTLSSVAAIELKERRLPTGSGAQLLGKLKQRPVHLLGRLILGAMSGVD